MNAWFELIPVAERALVFQLRKGSGELLLSSTVFRSEAEALSGIEALRRTAATPWRWQRLASDGPTHQFTVRDGGGELLAKSELHRMAWEMEWCLTEVLAALPSASLRLPAEHPRPAGDGPGEAQALMPGAAPSPPSR